MHLQSSNDIVVLPDFTRPDVPFFARPVRGMGDLFGNIPNPARMLDVADYVIFYVLSPRLHPF